MKAVFLCAGKGTRMRPLSYSVPKHLIPLANKPLLQYNVEMVTKIGIDQIGIVVSPDTIDLYRGYLGGKRWGTNFTYLLQENPKGLAHAVSCAEEFVGDEPFLVYLGDNLLNYNLGQMVDQFVDDKASASILLAPVEDPERFGVAQIENGEIERLLEKPDDPPTNLAIIGTYLFRKEIFEAIDEIEPSDRGEFEITDAIQLLIDDGRAVNPQIHNGLWIDVGRPADALEANKVLLEKIEGTKKSFPPGVEIENPQSITWGRNVEIDSCRIIGPVMIGDNVKLVDSSIGPFVSISKGSFIDNSSMERTIVMEEAKVLETSIVDSIIGERANLELSRGKYSLFVGNEGKIVAIND